MSRRAPNPREEQMKVDLFNARNPVGAPVRVRLDDGQTIDTATNAPAQLLGGHTAVIWCKDISGAYALSRVTPL